MEDKMRKSIMVAAGLASAAVLAVAGVASANTGTGSPARPPTDRTQATTAISQADAERAAVSAVAGATVTETRLDVDNGGTVWNVHLSTPNGPVEVKVDAQTGEVRVDDNGALGIAIVAGLNEMLADLSVSERGDDARIEEAARQSVRRVVRAHLGKKPLTDVHIVRI